MSKLICTGEQEDTLASIMQNLHRPNTMIDVSFVVVLFTGSDKNENCLLNNSELVSNQLPNPMQRHPNKMNTRQHTDDHKCLHFIFHKKK